MTFWPSKKNDLIRKTRLISKLMISQFDLQTITLDILPSMSRSKGNETMKFGQVTEYNKRNIFVQKLWRNLFLFFWKALYEVKASALQLSFKVSIYFDLYIYIILYIYIMYIYIYIYIYICMYNMYYIQCSPQLGIQ